VWQPRRRLGPKIVNVTGAWNFSDLHTSDTRARGTSTDGYSAGKPTTSTSVAARRRRCGVDPATAITSRRPSTRTFNDRQEAISAPPGFADAIAWLAGPTQGEAPHWHVTFAVADRDEMVARPIRLGASDLCGPMDTAWTKAAIVRDPQGPRSR
jgi:hypothetical protein